MRLWVVTFSAVGAMSLMRPSLCAPAGGAVTITRCASTSVFAHRFSVAPMMEYTDRHQRYLQRLLSKHTVLYTEMVTSQALAFSPSSERFLRASLPFEEPLVLQLGGADPKLMGQAAKMAKDYGYSEININSGCPSEKVAGSGAFGAALMLKPPLVADLASAIHSESGLPTTVKCRIGVDDQDSYDGLANFISTVSAPGVVRHFIVHARKAVLGKKFTPADNRKIPPLKYEYVYRLVKDFPELKFTLNGGVMTLDEAESHIRDHGVHGVMVGRAVVGDPFHWRHVDSRLYNQPDPGLSRRMVMEKYGEYARAEEVACGPRVRRALVKPLLNLVHGERGARAFRFLLSNEVSSQHIPIDEVIRMAMDQTEEESLDGC